MLGIKNVVMVDPGIQVFSDFQIFSIPQMAPEANGGHGGIPTVEQAFPRRERYHLGQCRYPSRRWGITNIPYTESGTIVWIFTTMPERWSPA